MTEAAASATAPHLEHVEVWAESFSAVLGQISGSPLPCSILSQAPADLTAAVAGDLWISCATTGGLRGELSLRIPPASAVRLAQVFMSEPPAPGELSAELREAALELLRQVAGLVASALKARWGELQLLLEAAAGAPSWPASETAWVRAGEDPATAPLIEMQLSAALMAGLRVVPEKAPEKVQEKVQEKEPEKASEKVPEKEQEKAAEVPLPPSPAFRPSASPPPAPLPLSPQDSKVKIELLMDVELGITLRFGGRRLLLREVLDLNPGSVIELDRQVQEPVDVLLDGRIVARGEIVVVDGNYGLRVTEVAPGPAV